MNQKTDMKRNWSKNQITDKKKIGTKAFNAIFVRKPSQNIMQIQKKMLVPLKYDTTLLACSLVYGKSIDATPITIFLK